MKNGSVVVGQSVQFMDTLGNLQGKISINPAAKFAYQEAYYGVFRMLLARQKNWLTRLVSSCDSAGRQRVNAYDFKGQPLAAEQELLQDYSITDADWANPPLLTGEVFLTSTSYDALGRPVIQTDAGGNATRHTYDRSGLLNGVLMTLAGSASEEAYVQDIHNDAKGQRAAIWYGNGTKTAYTYDPLTYRLRRLLTTAGSVIHQDLRYWYDPAGNITQLTDRAQQTLFFSNTVVSPDQDFTYDALYRLIKAEGREKKGAATFGTKDKWDDAAWKGGAMPGDPAAVQRYTQRYAYNGVGNILELKHIAVAGSYTRNYTYGTTSNRLQGTVVGSDSYNYSHDARGNMTSMPHLGTMEWNRQNELSYLADATLSTWDAYYQYSGGQRIRKVLEKAGGIREERIYLGGFEIYRKFTKKALTLERTTVHVADDTGRIAMVERRTVGTDTAPALLKRFIYSNHLQSASLELNDAAQIISYEEYHPYGTTAYQATNATINAVAKRYRYTRKERDEESGLYYHGDRYYMPWLGRWCAVDMLEGKYAGLSPYNYCFCNPVSWTDPSGNGPEDEEKKVTGSWYQDNNFELHFAPNIHNEAEFLKSEYAQKGTWWATAGGVGGGGNYTTDPYSSNYAPDGSITRSYASGKRERYDYDGAVYLLNKGDENFKLIKAAPKPKTIYTEDNSIPGSSNIPSNNNTKLKSEDNYDRLNIGIDLYSKALYIPQTATEFVTVFKPGIRLALGLEYSVAPRATQIGMLRQVAMFKKPVERAGRFLGFVNLFLSATKGALEYRETGTVSNSTITDIGFSGLLLTASFSTGPAAPFFWTAGLIYGGTRLIWGDKIDEWLNKEFGSWFNALKH